MRRTGTPRALRGGVFAHAAAERRLALVVVGAFLLAGGLWVLLTDLILYSLVDDPVVIARVETAKGGAFILGSALLLYLVIRWSAARLSHAQATTAAVLDSIGDAVLILDESRTIAHANPAAVRMLRTRDLVGMGADTFSRRFRVSYPSGEIVPPHQFVSQRAFDQRGTLTYKAVIHPQGAPDVVVLATAAAVCSSTEEPVGRVVSVMHDITANERLDQLRDDLFTATAHSVKTPVAIIKSTAQILPARTPDVRRAAAAIERQCARIERLIENVLVLARSRSGTLQIHAVPMALGPVVEAAATEARRLAPDREIRTTLDANARVHADHERIRMVLRNVLHRAIRLSAAAAPIEVVLTLADGDASLAVRYVPDPAIDGPGASGIADYDDAGVSRYVTTVILDSHGGATREDTTDGTTTVTIRLPAMAAEEAA